MTHTNQTIAGLILASILACTAGAQNSPPGTHRPSVDTQSENNPQPSAWESPARLRNGFGRGTPGNVRADSKGVEFVPSKGASRRWTFIEIRDVDLQRYRVVLIGYDNRRSHLPGTQRFDFELKNEITPAVAASITEKMARPVRNRVPDSSAPSVSVIAVRRSGQFGGSNGFLHIRQQGIDYITAEPGQSRSWRWLDLQTISNPDPYHFFVFGYRDNFAFDLKEMLSRELFNHLSDEIWTHNEGEIKRSALPFPPSTTTDGGRK